MLLKRIYDTSGKEPRLIGVKLLRSGPRQRFSPRIVQRGITEGWLAIGKSMISLITDPPVIYKIVRPPGMYCCHCNESVNDSSSALVHISAKHSGKKSPDSSNPAGYRKDNFYECVKVKRVFGKFKEVK